MSGTAGIEVPVHDATGAATGRAVQVPSPPPEVWVDSGERLVLTRYEELERFGCGCIRHERLAYVPAERDTASAAQPSRGPTRKVAR